VGRYKVDVVDHFFDDHRVHSFRRRQIHQPLFFVVIFQSNKVGTGAAVERASEAIRVRDAFANQFLDFRELRVHLVPLGHLHPQHSRQLLESVHSSRAENQAAAHPQEHHPDPVRHVVRGAVPVVDVQDDHCRQDGYCDQKHGEQQVLGEQWNHQAGRRNKFDENQEKHAQGYQHRNGERDLNRTVFGPNDKKLKRMYFQENIFSFYQLNLISKTS